MSNTTPDRLKLIREFVRMSSETEGVWSADVSFVSWLLSEFDRVTSERANLLDFTVHLIHKADPLTGCTPIQIAMTNMIDNRGRDQTAVIDALAEHDRKHREATS